MPSITKKTLIKSVIYLTFSITIVSCTDSSNKEIQKPWIKIQTKEKLQSINPLNITDGFSNFITNLIFQPLLAVDFESNELVGVVAKERPTIIRDGDKIEIKYTLKEGVYFKELPLTAEDVEFSLKLNVCPYVNPYYADYYKFIDSISLNETDSLQFSIYGSGSYHLNEYVSGDYSIFSKRLLDSNNILSNYSIKDMKQLNSERINENLKNYLDKIKKSNFLEFPIAGSGPLEINTFNDKLTLRLEKKENWWGDSYRSNSFLKANADKLEFITIKDDATALNALKARELDVFPNIQSKDYLNLKESSEFNKYFDFSMADRNAYFYLGFNTKSKYLQNLYLRKAIAFALDKKDIIENLENGLATSLNAPFETKVNSSLNSYKHNKDSIKFYMDKFKVENNNRTEKLSISYSYNSENKTRESIGLLLKQSLKEYGVEIELKAYEWSIYLQKLKSGEIELFINGSSTSSLPPDFSNSFHSNSTENGRNYANYTNPKVDTLIESINVDLNEESRMAKIESLQKIINNELPYYYLYKPKRIIAFSKSLKNTATYSQRPNYWPQLLNWK